MLSTGDVPVGPWANEGITRRFFADVNYFAGVTFIAGADPFSGRKKPEHATHTPALNVSISLYHGRTLVVPCYPLFKV